MKADEFLKKREETRGGSEAVPKKPVEGVILAPGVVVSFFCVAILVSHQ